VIAGSGKTASNQGALFRGLQGRIKLRGYGTTTNPRARAQESPSPIGSFNLASVNQASFQTRTTLIDFTSSGISLTGSGSGIKGNS